ncbi:MAG TPA: hypothetical protein DGX96_01025 [Lachnospiraceae bacterium]|nr:hypothetical protein [Lachnospiraceae bacterium]
MILQSVKMAWKSITSHKMRSFLTMLGIIIGIFALVVLVSLVDGASSTITDSVNSMGTNMISVSVADDHSRPIKMEDLQEIRDLSTVDEVAPSVNAQITATGAHGSETVMATGTTAGYADIENLTIDTGRFLMKPDVDNSSNVVVINAALATDVMGRTDVTGETIRLNGRNFLIVGVLKKNDSDSMMSAFTGQYAAYVPFPSLVRLSSMLSYDVTSFELSAAGDDTKAAQSDIEDYLLARFDNDDKAYTLFNMSQVADTMNTVMSTLSLLLGGIAAISLLVGGIGIMNMMLVSVTERTREIGLRKALGAEPRRIQIQFLMESILLSLIGGAIGIVFGLLIAFIGSSVLNTTFRISYGAIALGAGFSAAVGIIFGWMPAKRASELNPIDALRAD